MLLKDDGRRTGARGRHKMAGVRARMATSSCECSAPARDIPVPTGVGVRQEILATISQHTTTYITKSRLRLRWPCTVVELDTVKVGCLWIFAGERVRGERRRRGHRATGKATAGAFWRPCSIPCPEFPGIGPRPCICWQGASRRRPCTVWLAEKLVFARFAGPSRSGSTGWISAPPMTFRRPLVGERASAEDHR